MNEKPDQTNPVLLEIGKILKPHGLNGEVIVSLSTNRTDRLNPGSVVNTEEMKLRIKASRPHAKNFIVQFKGIENREKAEELRGEFLYAESINDGTIWAHELVGAKVVDQHDNNRGTVVSVVHNPASDLMELEDGNLVPLTFLTSYKPGEVIFVTTPEGLFMEDQKAERDR